MASKAEPRDIMKVEKQRNVTADEVDRCLLYFLISNNLMSKTRVELAGIPGRDLLPYARFEGIVNRRSPPTAIPATPMSQPLMTSPVPSLKENGLPLLFAK
jgi:hypothetical protein